MNNPGLEELYLSDNDLNSPTVMNLQALIDNSKLKILVLNNVKMTQQVVEKLANVIKNSSSLEILDLKNNALGSSAVMIFRALKDNCKLKTLNLTNNNMTGYIAEDLANVIKNNSGLEQLYLSGNDLKLSTVVILQALTNNLQLKILNLSKNSMTGQVAENLANVIKNNSGLEELYLSDNDIKLAAVVILQALKNNSQLKILNLNNNNMTGQVTDDFNENHPGLDQPYLSDEDLKSSAVLILQALENNSQLQKLSLNSYYISGRVAEDLAYIIMNNPGLEELYLSDNDLISPTVMNLQALIDNSKLKILALNNIKMTQQVVEDLAVIIKNCTNLQLLNLRNNALGSSAVVILQALEDNCQLKILDLSNNRMTGHVTEDLANVIVNNPGLVQLSLSDNYLNSSIVMVLQVLNHLETLSFSSNNMTGQIAKDLANIIKNNASLKILDLSDNDLKSLASVILQGLKDNSQLKLLALNSNNITGQLAEDLAIVIKNNSGLEGLYLSNNNLKSSAVVILQALEINTQLGFLHLNNNRMTGQISENLANVIKNNLCLKELDICNNDLKSYVIVILQALCSISQLEMLSLDNNFLTDLTSIEIISVMKSNPLITKLWLGDNMLQSALIDITVNCKSLRNLQALGLSHNSINPTEVPRLASVVANINSLQVLLFGGLVLNVEETFLFQFYNACKQKLVLQSNNNSNDNELIEIGCLVLWRLQFTGRAKYYCYDRNVFWTSTTIMQAILVDIKPNLNTVLSPAKQLEQRMSQLEATNMIISLFVIIKSLKVLDLGHSNINKEAAIKLATALNCNNVLEQLWLTSNVLGADGAAVILTSLQNISTLRIFDLSYNNIQY